MDDILIGCCSTPPRLKYYDALLFDVSIRSRFDQYVSATRQCFRCLLSGTSGSIDADLIMSTHVTTTVRACFAALRRIRSVRRSLIRDALLTLLRALVISDHQR